jgi:hypothetical protein
MSMQRLSLVLTLVNVVLLLCLSSQARNVDASAGAPILRGKALEIVDDAGRVRASISVVPADPNAKLPDGTVGYPESVLLRLTDSKGKPNVKIETTERGSGLNLLGESDQPNVQIIARGDTASMSIVDKHGTSHVITP